jgi:hypothetical protein
MSETEATLMDVIGGCLTTEEGKNVPETLLDLVEAINAVSSQLEVQNKILIKILTKLSVEKEA